MRNALFAALFTLAGALTASAQNRIIYFPQIADGVQGGGFFWKTTIYITNPAPAGSAPVSGSISIVAPNGAPLPIAFVNESGQPAGGSTVPFQIAGTQTRKFISTSAGRIESGIGLGAVTTTGEVSGTAIFSFFGPAGLISEAAVPAVVAPALRQAIIVDTTEGFDTGVAFAHTGLGALPVTLTLLNVDGVQVMSTTANQDSPVYQSAKFVSSLFVPLVPPPMVGTLQIASTAPVAAVGLRFSSTGTFATVPSVILGALMQPALQFFQQKPWLPTFSSVAKLFAGLHYWRV